MLFFYCRVSLEADARGELHSVVIRYAVYNLVFLERTGLLWIKRSVIELDDRNGSRAIRARHASVSKERNIAVARERAALPLAPLLIQQIAKVEDVELYRNPLSRRHQRNVLAYRQIEGVRPWQAARVACHDFAP